MKKILITLALSAACLSNELVAETFKGVGDIIPTHVAALDGLEPKEERVYLPVEPGTEIEQLEGATYRANNNHDGWYKASGVAKLKGLKWSFDTGGKVRSNPVVVDGVLYVGSLNGKFYAIDAQTGEEKWAFKTKGEIYSSPTVYDGVVYFGSADAHLYALNLDGTLLWKVKGLYTDEGKVEKFYTTQGGELPEVSSAPVVGYGYVFAGVNKQIRAFDLKTGEEKFSNSKVGLSSMRSTITLHNGAYFQSYGHIGFQGFLLKTLRVIPRMSTVGNSSANKTAFIYNNCVYYLGIFADLHVGDLATEKCKMIIMYDKEKRDNIGKSAAGRYQTMSAPGFAQGLAFMATTRGLVGAFNADTGKKAWTADLGEKTEIYTAPSMSNEHVYVADHKGKFYCLDLKTGKTLWTYQTGDQIIGAAYVGDGAVYFGSDDGKIYCLE